MQTAPFLLLERICRILLTFSSNRGIIKDDFEKRRKMIFYD